VTDPRDPVQERHAKIERGVKHAFYGFIAFTVALLLGVTAVTIVDLTTITKETRQDHHTTSGTLAAIDKKLTAEGTTLTAEKAALVTEAAKLAVAETVNACQNKAFDLILKELKELGTGHKLKTFSLGPSC
jgi:hypothetical protein